MPWFTYECSVCKSRSKYGLARRQPKLSCPACQEDAYPVIIIGNVSVNERLDNGAMARAVERPHNIEELIDEHSSDPIPERVVGEEEPESQDD